MAWNPEWEAVGRFLAILKRLEPIRRQLSQSFAWFFRQRPAASKPQLVNVAGLEVILIGRSTLDRAVAD